MGKEDSQKFCSGKQEVTTGCTRMMVLDGAKGILEGRVTSGNIVEDEGNRGINCTFLVCIIGRWQRYSVFYFFFFWSVIYGG